jgi:hypothetical protein
VNELQQKMSRFHGLTASNPERKTVGASVEAGCESLRWQLTELDAAVGRAAADPGRFNLTAQEIEGRRRWVTNTRRQVDGMSEALKTALAAPPPPSADAKFVAANDKFLSSQAGQQEMVLKARRGARASGACCAQNTPREPACSRARAPPPLSRRAAPGCGPQPLPMLTLEPSLLAHKTVTHKNYSPTPPKTTPKNNTQKKKSQAGARPAPG